MGEMLQELSRAMNFTISLLIKDPFFGSYEPQKSKWNGVIGKIVQSEIDMGAAEFSMTHERTDVVDFTIPIVIGDCRLYVRKLNDAQLQWNAYFGVFMNYWLLVL